MSILVYVYVVHCCFQNTHSLQLILCRTQSQWARGYCFIREEPTSSEKARLDPFLFVAGHKVFLLAQKDQ